MDFRIDVQLMCQSLQLKTGIENVKSYYGKGMSIETKKKIDAEFRNKQFQILVATESYEVATHSPHVENIFRVG